MSLRIHTTLLVGVLTIWNVAARSSAQDDAPEPFRLQMSRIPHLAESEWNERQRELLSPYRREDGSVLNVLTTIVRHPDLFYAYMPFVAYVMQGQTLPARDREMLILRIGWLCQAEYEYGHHTLFGNEAGLTPVLEFGRLRTI